MGFFQYGMLVEQLATTATAAGTTTLVNTSKQIQTFTGSTTQTVVLPNATTMSVGQFFEIYNQSSGSLTIQFNGGGSFTDASGTSYGTLVAHTTLIVKLQTNGTSAGTWSVVTTPATIGVITSSNVSTATFTAPTVQKFLSGSGTYTTPTSPRTPLYLRVRMVGGGGGGSGSGTVSAGSGGNGGNTLFGTTLLNAGGGTGGTFTASGGGAGGTSSLGGTTGLALTGGTGGGGGYMITVNSAYVPGGNGGSSAFGGAGGGGSTGASNGTGGAANTGGGGGGGSTGNAGGDYGGNGGGSGGFVDAIITSPSSTYSYVVGSAGSAGTAGTSGAAGGAGGSGFIVVEEFYQ